MRDYDKIQDALNKARTLELNVPELSEAQALLKQLEAAPLPAAVATGTMAQILDISRGARWRFEKFGGLRPQERFAKGRLMLASTKKKVQEGMLTYTKEVVPRCVSALAQPADPRSAGAGAPPPSQVSARPGELAGQASCAVPQVPARVLRRSENHLPRCRWAPHPHDWRPGTSLCSPCLTSVDRLHETK